MSITTYAELKTAIANQLHRTDLTSYIPDFIKGAEDIIAYGITIPGVEIDGIRVGDMETRATASVSTQYVAFPTGFLELRNIQLNTDPVTSLDYMTPEQIDQRWAGSETAKPLVYTIVGNEFQFAPIPDSTYTAEISYLKKYTAFSADADYNWLLTNHPNLYLYAALAKAKEFIEDQGPYNASYYYSMYGSLAKGLNSVERNKKYLGSTLVTRSRVYV